MTRPPTRAPALPPPLRAGHRSWPAWQCALDLCVACHELAGRLPPPHRRALGPALRRAADVVPTGVARAHDAPHRGLAAHRLLAARGALRALETRLAVAGRLCPGVAGAAAALERRCRLADRVLAREVRALGRGARPAGVTAEGGRASQRTPAAPAATLERPNTLSRARL